MARNVRTKRRVKKNIPTGIAHIHATFNNTIITITDLDGNVVSWGSAGSNGFKGTRKATPYAASVAAQSAATKCKSYGMEKINVYVRVVGSGREQSIRALQSSGLLVLSIKDITPVPHNGA